MEMLTTDQLHGVLAGQVNDKIERLEEVTSQIAQVDVPVKDYFIDGMYAREIFIPKGTLLTGRVYKSAYLDIMISGDITVATPDGTKRVQGYHVMDGQPGRKRAGYAHEDTRWITVHRTEHKDPTDIIEQLSFFSMSQYRNYQNKVDSDDYQALLEFTGITEEEVQAQVNADDMVELPEEYAPLVYVSQSDKNGDGLFANANFNAGDHIIPARIAGCRTVGGRYSNHSVAPNACMVLLDNRDIALVAIKPIMVGEEITTNYRDTLRNVWGQPCQE